jgi:hypothetical protein
MAPAGDVDDDDDGTASYTEQDLYGSMAPSSGQESLVNSVYVKELAS